MFGFITHFFLFFLRWWLQLVIYYLGNKFTVFWQCEVLTGRLEFCGVEASLSHRIKPETVTISPCLLVFKTSATDVMGGAAGGTYLNGMAIVETSLTMLFWCINTMPLWTTLRLVMVMGWLFVMSSIELIIILIFSVWSTAVCRMMSK